MLYKKYSCICFIVVCMALLAGCAAGKNIKPKNNTNSTLALNQNIAKVDVLSSENKLLKTINEKQALDEFSKETAFTASGNSEAKNDSTVLSGDKTVRNIFNVYKKSAVTGSNDFEKIYSLITYKDTDAVDVQVPPETVKNMDIPRNLLRFALKAPSDSIKYLNELANEKV